MNLQWREISVGDMFISTINGCSYIIVGIKPGAERMYFTWMKSNGEITRTWLPAGSHVPRSYTVVKNEPAVE